MPRLPRKPWLRYFVMPQQSRHRRISQPVPDNPPVPLRRHDRGHAQVPQRLRHRRVVHSRRGGEVGHTDRPGGVNARQDHQPGGVAKHREPLGTRRDILRTAKRLDGLADPFPIDDTVIGSFRGQQMHVSKCGTTAVPYI